MASLAAMAFGAAAFAQSDWKAHPTVEDELKGSAVAVVGTVVKSRNVSDKDGFVMGTFYSVRVKEVLTGAPSSAVELYSENSSGRFPMKVGIRYLIFAHENSFEGFDGPRLAINNCGNSGTVANSKKALVKVRALKTTAG